MTDDEIRQRLLVSLELAHENFQRREAIGWLVLCTDEQDDHVVVGAYGPFATPEEALVEAGKHDASSLEGFRNDVIPLMPQVDWKDAR